MAEKRIRAVFFDVGNTLIYLDYQFIAENLRECGTEATAEDVRVAEFAARRAVDAYLAAGDVEDEEVWRIYFATIFKEVGLEDSETAKAMFDRLRARNNFSGLWSHVPEETLITLKWFKKEGYKIGVISNADGRLAGLLDSCGISEYLDFAIDSKVVGFEKPDPRIFRLALEKADEPAAACVHVGDIVSADIEGAKGVGIQPVLLDQAGMHSVDCPRISVISELIDLVSGWNGGGGV